jgi:hypothetical protein
LIRRRASRLTTGIGEMCLSIPWRYSSLGFTYLIGLSSSLSSIVKNFNK